MMCEQTVKWFFIYLILYEGKGYIEYDHLAAGIFMIPVK